MTTDSSDGPKDKALALLTAKLRARGWTNRSIEKFLGNPDLTSHYYFHHCDGLRAWTDAACGIHLSAHSNINLYDRARVIRSAQERIREQLKPKERKLLMRELVEANAELIADKGIQ